MFDSYFWGVTNFNKELLFINTGASLFVKLKTKWDKN